MSVGSLITCSQPRILDEYVVVHYQRERFIYKQSIQTEDMYTEMIPPYLYTPDSLPYCIDVIQIYSLHHHYADIEL